MLVDGCTLSGVYSFNLTGSGTSNYTMTFVDTVFNDWTSYDNVAKEVKFTQCTFNGVLKPYGDTLLQSCKFVVDSTGKTSIDLSKLAIGEKITLKECTFGENTIDEVVIENNAETGLICAPNFATRSDDSMLVVRKGTG